MDVPDGFTPFPNQGPFLEHVGPIHVREADDGHPILGIRAEDRHINHRGTIQGGMLSTFADFALARAIEFDASDDHERATVSLTVDYLKPAEPGEWIESRASVDRVGRTLAFADCTLVVGEREIVRARAVYVVAD
jgi:acyl-coenzyme A thioesterase 13